MGVDPLNAMTRVAVLQSNYIPWKGYFDIIHDVDLFVFYDDVQYTKNDWRNRNKIKTPSGAQWLTVPVGIDSHRLICEVSLPSDDWQRKHWKAIELNYRPCPHFERYRSEFEPIYLGTRWRTLSELNQHLIGVIARILRLSTRLTDSRLYNAQGSRQDRLLDLLRKVGASAYVSGPAAQAYIQPERFAQAGIELVWKDYSGYPEYPQRFPPFVHGVSILDLLFNVGSEAPAYIWNCAKSRRS